MSGSLFGSGYWPNDYFGMYFQPDSGGVIVGTLSGSFAGSATFTGTLELTSAIDPGTKPKRWLYAVEADEIVLSLSAARTYDQAVKKQNLADKIDQQKDDEEAIWLLVA